MSKLVFLYSLSLLWIMSSCSGTKQLDQPDCLAAAKAKLRAAGFELVFPGNGQIVVDTSKMKRPEKILYGYDCKYMKDTQWEFQLNYYKDVYPRIEFARALSYLFQDSTCKITYSNIIDWLGEPMEYGRNKGEGPIFLINYDVYFGIESIPNLPIGHRDDKHLLFDSDRGSRLVDGFSFGSIPCVSIAEVLRRTDIETGELIE